MMIFLDGTPVTTHQLNEAIKNSPGYTVIELVSMDKENEYLYFETHVYGNKEELK